MPGAVVRHPPSCGYSTVRQPQLLEQMRLAARSVQLTPDDHHRLQVFRKTESPVPSSGIRGSFLGAGRARLPAWARAFPSRPSEAWNRSMTSAKTVRHAATRCPTGGTFTARPVTGALGVRVCRKVL